METSIRVLHKDGSVGILLTDIDGIGWGPDTTGAQSIPVHWIAGPRHHASDAANHTFNRVDMIVEMWSINDPEFRIPVTV